MAGLFGHGDAFVLRDPNGIRPAFYYADDEVVVVASERPVIQTAFNVPIETIHEIPRGNALIVKKDGQYDLHEINAPLENKACSFERIYFSRGNDKDIYKERLELGRSLTNRVLKSVDYDTRNTVVSFIPNTAELSFYGLKDGLEEYLNEKKKDAILNGGRQLSAETVREILGERLRVEKIAWKDVKLRTFIAEDSSRDELVSHVYDTSYGIVKPEDNLVVIDDSIVRGTTLKQSILRILDRLHPKKIVVVSSAPQIRYPDCYGIDMAKMGDFIAFRAAIALLKDRGMESRVQEVYEKAKAQVGIADSEVKNFVKEIYDPFTPEEISIKIAEILRPKEMKADLEIIFQSIGTLHKACPDHPGDWYFTGDFPTPGGNRVVNKAFMYFVEGRTERAY
jgi:amidophosphoribosyltransferase